MATGLLRLVDPLDDPQHYCADVTGFGDGIRLDAPLQAHTCKPGSADQMFAPSDSPAGGPVLLVKYERCLAATSIEAGTTLAVEQCDGSSPTSDFIC